MKKNNGSPRKMKSEKMKKNTVLNWGDFLMKRLNIEEFMPYFLEHAFYSDGTETFTVEFRFPFSTRRFATIVNKVDKKYVDYFVTHEEAESFIQAGSEQKEFVALAIVDKAKGKEGIIWYNMQYSKKEIHDLCMKYIKAFAFAPDVNPNLSISKGED